MIIIGADFHPAYQEIASVNTDTGEYQEKRLTHPKEAEEFYRGLASVGQAVRVGMEASGQGQWFERLLEQLRLELWRGDAEQIRAKRGRKQKTDREDARHILKLLLKDDFPRIWVPMGKPGSAATAVAPPPHGAGADASDESTAGGGAEGRATL